MVTSKGHGLYRSGLGKQGQAGLGDNLEFGGPIMRPKCLGIGTLHSLEGGSTLRGRGESYSHKTGGQEGVCSHAGPLAPNTTCLVPAKLRVARYLWTPSSFQPAWPVRTHPAQSQNPQVSPTSHSKPWEAQSDPWELHCPVRKPLTTSGYLY